MAFLRVIMAVVGFFIAISGFEESKVNNPSRVAVGAILFIAVSSCWCLEHETSFELRTLPSTHSD